MENSVIFTVIFGAITFVGAIEIVYQIYRLTIIDAEARGLKHPKLWGLFAMNGNNSGGLLMYLAGRRKYPITHLSESSRKDMEKRKKSAGIGLAFLSAGAIGMIFTMLFG